MSADQKAGGFEQVVLPHLDAAYNLARWLTHRDHDAQDVVQEAYLRAFKAFDQFHGQSGDARCWLLTIVRNTCFSWMQRHRPAASTVPFEPTMHERQNDASDPLVILQLRDDRQAVRRAIEELPVDFREVLILREFENLSYQQIATVTDLPLGTVMSRLARARDRLHKSLCARMIEEA